VKRAFDLSAATLGLIVLSPVLVAIAAAVRLSSPGPVLYHQERVGLNGHTFVVHKFRTMRLDAEAGTGPVWSVTDDPRVTRLGAFLLRARLDELPQLWNILKGEMSFAGPRPDGRVQSQLTGTIPFTVSVVVKPGPTGWAQFATPMERASNAFTAD
jgi:lipopolysaccharide/colanic/teichoic acid biosynthesis glycosyltransferase